jgi:hypothetical protein
MLEILGDFLIGIFVYYVMFYLMRRFHARKNEGLQVAPANPPDFSGAARKIQKI